jgi:TPR repeat protein
LGLCYKTGGGVPVNKKLAIKWLRLAAKQGYKKAKLKINELIA